ncbi:Flagellin [Luteitalea pratensis]|jgi:flagellin|uniref:Flagellin n=1 Tax=Luteitalea pratensis TaxID=1855912 RepID=A0A143PQK6_LUTPR|nr:flagellin [Luteitalea pratensis]AMY10400.1 Flagellin [Luteitalea pratensis]
MASFSVITNVAANNAQANLYSTNIGLRNALTRVSSGFRINSSGDDAAGLAVANGYRSTIAVLNQGVRNANDGLSDLQIKDGALDNVSKLLDRLSTLATQAASGQTTSTSRTTLDAEFQDVLNEINRESNVANLSSAQGFSVFVSNNSANGRVGGSIGAVTTTSLGINADALTSQTGAQTAVANIATAVNTLGSVQGQVGQLQNRLSYAISLAQSQIVNNRAAESRIRDANIAEESANLTRFSILNQSGIAALAQANGQTAAVLSLLRG